MPQWRLAVAKQIAKKKLKKFPNGQVINLYGMADLIEWNVDGAEIQIPVQEVHAYFKNEPIISANSRVGPYFDCAGVVIYKRVGKLWGITYSSLLYFVPGKEFNSEWITGERGAIIGTPVDAAHKIPLWVPDPYLSSLNEVLHRAIRENGLTTAPDAD